MSCLFDSLSVYLRLAPLQVRNIICDYLESNRTILEGVDTHSMIEQEHPEYVTWMRNNATWGGAIEIKAACDIWNVVITVHSICDDHSRGIQFVPSRTTDDFSDCGRIVLQWNGSHYYI